MSSSLFHLFYSKDVAGAASILSRDGLRTASTAIAGHTGRGSRLTKQDINKRDALGRTVLHLAASKGSLDFVRALLENPTTDVNLLDPESGWCVASPDPRLIIRSALHRALYHGRIACAQYIIAVRGRDTIKVKDHESNSPFDVLNSTLTGTNPPPLDGEYGGSDLYTFGSNKNNNLGFGDGDDRSHPERVQVIRPPRKDENPISAFRPSRIRDVQIARMHTAILTTDDKDNLYVCGFNGSTGRYLRAFCIIIDSRLGLSATPSPGTQFLPKQVHGINEQVILVALGQDHTVTLTKFGAVYTWGSNQYGQLGYILDLGVNKDNVQRIPRKIVAPLKRIEIIGVATSNVHSVCFSKEDLYTWGLNRGQLGYSAGDEGPIQFLPKKVASLPSEVEMATAIDHATICLLRNKTVMVFENGGYFRVRSASSSSFSNK
jgi:inhibitor of Bruton tyrosine kinase